MRVAVFEDILRSKWLLNQADREADREYLTNGERIGEAFSLVGSTIVIAFFAIHQTRPTGFFLDDTAPVLIYLVLAYGMVPSAIRMLFGSRNIARPLEAIGILIFLVVAVYLIIDFPFEMSRFAQPLPHDLEFLLEWIPGSLIKWILGVGAVACAFFGPYTFMMYPAVKKILAEEEVGQPEP